MRVGLPLKPIDKPKTLCEVGEMGVEPTSGQTGRKARRERVVGDNHRRRNLSWFNPHLPHDQEKPLK